MSMNKTEIVCTRFSAEDRVILEEAAAGFGVPLSVFLRQAALAAAEAVQRGGTAQCRHLSIGRVRSAICWVCGELPVDYSGVLAFQQ
jgi:hypothetical protein